MNNNKSFASHSAPFPIIFSGIATEQFGKPVLACALTARVVVSVKKSQKKHQIDSELLLLVEKEVKEHLRRKSIRFQVTRYEATVEYDKKIISDISSSAALIVAATASFLLFFTKKPFPETEVNMIAHSILKKIDRTDLGYRTSASTFGGIIYARREFEFLKVVSRMSFQFSRSLCTGMFLVYPEKTELLSSDVIGRFYNKNSKRAESYLTDFEKNTRKIAVALASKNRALLIDAFKNNASIWKKFYKKNSYPGIALPVFIEKTPALLVISDKRLSPFPFEPDTKGLQRLMDSR